MENVAQRKVGVHTFANLLFHLLSAFEHISPKLSSNRTKYEQDMVKSEFTGCSFLV